MKLSEIGSPETIFKHSYFQLEPEAVSKFVIFSQKSDESI